MDGQSIISDKEKLACLRLIRSENIGIRTFYTLLKYYGSASTAISKFSDLPRLNLRTKHVTLASEASIERELEQVTKLGASMVFYQDEDYPWLLKLTGDVPPFLTILGRKELLQQETVAIVGSRNASINGMSFAKKIAYELSRSGLAVVSGLARGIDSSAHRGSVEAGTIAVIAGGINNIYPPENESLYKEIAEKGLILAENPYGTTPVASSFPQRNRIISGLAIGTVVVEASLKSGSLITARFAAEQGRNVFAVPGFPLDYRYSGTNHLLKQGALLVESSQDILDHLKYNRFKQLELVTNEFGQENSSKDLVEIKQNVAQIQELILSSIGFTPTSIDDLVLAHNLSIDIIQVAILELELDGKIVKGSNNTITLMS